MLYHYARVKFGVLVDAGCQTFKTRLDFLEALNRWNRNGINEWVFYEISEDWYDQIKNNNSR